MINNCERCTKHTFHCCKADIPYSITDVMYMKYLATKKYKLYEPNEVYISKHPSENMQDLYSIIRTKDLDPTKDNDIRNLNCIFFNTGSGKCDVYEDRPMICRQYMSDFMRCRFDHKEFTDVEFSSMSFSTIRHLDQEAFKRSALMAIKPYNE